MKNTIYEKLFRRLLLWGAAVFCTLLPLSGMYAAEISVAQANAMAGGYLFSDVPLWKLPDSNFAKRNKLKLVSMPGGRDETTASVFLKRKVKWFGLPVEEIKVDSKNGRITGITFVFFNKGDSVKSGSKKSALSKKLQREERTLIRQISRTAGASQGKFFGVNKRRCRVWQCREAALVMEYQSREYMQLHVVPPAKVSDSRQKSDDQEIDRREFESTANLMRSDSGDVYIGSVPMVDQGSKGYCVPATLERCFRYYGVNEVDMHRIAAVSKTKLGGGTEINKSLSGIGSLLSRYNLRYENCGALRLNQISKRIDKGYPVLWALYSSPEYMKRMRENNSKRAKMIAADPDNWKEFIKDQKRIKKSEKGPHVCLIIGYNRKTGEIAVTNSWGRAGAMAWVPFRDAAVADADENLYIIRPR